MTLVPIGSEVIIWTRTSSKVILLLGQGRYEGDNYINGDKFPVIKLDDGREITMHFQGVVMGRKESVAATCKTFKGHVLAWDIEDYLAGKRPAQEDYAQVQQESGLPTNGEPLPEPKTATDKLMRLREEINYEESKKKMANEVIAKADSNIAEKRQQIANLKATVLAELAAIDGIAPEPGAAVTIVVPAQRPYDFVKIEQPQQDQFDDEAKRNALND